MKIPKVWKVSDDAMFAEDVECEVAIHGVNSGEYIMVKPNDSREGWCIPMWLIMLISDTSGRRPCVTGELPSGETLRGGPCHD